MTSRPPLGVQQRPPPQHKLSGPTLSQRPAVAHQRALSQHQQQPQKQQQKQQQQHLQQQQQQQLQLQQIQQQQSQAQQQQSQPQQFPPPSPIRKDAAAISALYDFPPADSADGATARHGVQRRAGSRLKLELSRDATDPFVPHTLATGSPNTAESSKPFTPSRIIPHTDSSDLGDMSPHLSAHPLSVEEDVPFPMPCRPPPFVASNPRRGMLPPPTNPNPIKKETRPKPYTVEPPAAAPRYATLADSKSRTNGFAPPKTGYADFSPWTGHHPEDQFSDNVIRNGYYDKGSFATAETQSAKNILFPALKHKTGLSALSSVFTAILGQRRHTGHITAPSTFKPPPRVTLTDTKRDLWLKDLANPAILLRRLSRTIPHGIRGKVLLEQCLNKHVPTDRAVWLIKCVGANEIRATKRKGVSTLVMGGETRWIKDWTVSVEQFIESVYFAFDQEDWKARVHYTTRLAAHLYAEQLLDREHYSEWLVSNFENSTDAKLPMWLLMTQLYWKDLLKLRKYGRRLVAALISHHHLIYNHPDKDILHPLLDNLTQCLNALILTSPENFVSPSTWSKYRDALKACLPAGDEARHSAFSAISLRNEQLAAAANRSQPAARHILVRMLDGTLQAPMPDELPAQCWGISKDKEALAQALLEWCTSLYRPGLAKVYVTSRILQHWRTLGLDTTVAVLAFLEADACEERDRKPMLYHLVCELVRSSAFSVSVYIQWLMARGGARSPELVSRDGPGPTRLLVEVPTHALTPSQRNLRGEVLRRASFSVTDAAADVELAIKHLQRALGMQVEASDLKPLSLPKLTKRIASADRSLKAELGQWLRANVAAHVEEMEKEGSQAGEISPSVFYAMRSVLEAAEDFSILNDILKMFTKHSNVEILAAITDTVSRHFLIFSALGVASPLFRSLHQRFRAAAQEQGLALRPLLASLVTLAPRIPGMEELASQLRKDLALSDRQNPVDACSPVSDNMVARLQDDAGELHEEIEKLLAGGSSVDRNTMERLFQTIVQRLQASWTKASDKQRAYSSLLGRLRLFNAQHFDGLMVKWLLSLRTLGNRPSILRILPLLVSVGCVDMVAILATTSDFSAGQGVAPARTPTAAAAASTPQVVQITYRTRYMQEVLQLLTAPIRQDDLLTTDEVYRFSILQEQAVRESPKEVLGLIFLASAEYSFAKAQNDLEGLPLESESVQRNLLELLKRLVLRDAAGVVRLLGIKSPNAQAGGWMDNVTTKLLIPTADGSPRVSFDQVLELTNEFTLPFCQVKLALSLSTNEQAGHENTERQQSHVELFANAMDKAISVGNISWVGMLSCLSPEITQHLKVRAQTRFLELLPSFRNPPRADGALSQNLQMAENLLSVIDAIMRGSPPGSRQPQLSPAVAEKLVDLWEVLAARPDDQSQSRSPDAMVIDSVDNPDDEIFAATTQANSNPKTTVLAHWLPLMLNFITLHAHAFDLSKPTSDVRAKILVACAGLLQELDALHLPGTGVDTQPLSRRVFDLSCLLVDNLAEDARLMCVRAVKDCAGSDARLRYLFSFPSSSSSVSGGCAAENGGDGGGTLMLAHREKPGMGMPLAGFGRPTATTTTTTTNNTTTPTTTTTPTGTIPTAGAATAAFNALLGTPAWGAVDRGPMGERLSLFHFRRWEMLNEPTPNVGENDTALSLGLFEARRVQ